MNYPALQAALLRAEGKRHRQVKALEATEAEIAALTEVLKGKKN